MQKPLSVALMLLCVTTTFGFDHWPRFRGPNADGVSDDHPGLPESWNATENIKWVAEVPGWGWSCPVVWGDRVFLSTVVSDEKNLTPNKGLYLGRGVRDPAKGIHHWLVYCFDLNTGKEIWKQEAHVGQPKVPRHPKSTYAAETATTDGQRLYVLFGDLGLYCYDLAGDLLWSRPIEPKKTFMDYGAAASPVVHDDQVIVVYDNSENSWIAAFDTKTGEERWKTPRDETHSWSTPYVWENDLRTEIVVPGKQRNRSYSLKGELLWEFDGEMSNLVIPSPFAANGLCYIASGYIGDSHRPTFAIRPGASGDITPKGDYAASEFIQWYQPTASAYNTTQIVYDDYLYTVYDQGFITCHDAKTGEQVYGKKRFSPGGSFTASPFAYNGHIFCLSEDGLTYVVKAGPEYELVATNALDELCLSTPAAVGDKLLIRTASKLYCLTDGAKLATGNHMQPRRKASSYEDVWAAVRSGDRKKVATFLVAGSKVNAKQPGTGLTLLNTATIYGHTEIARMLIDKGADVSIAGADGNTALHIASFFTHVDIVEMLLEHGAVVSAQNGRGETPLQIVTGEWNPKLAETYRSVARIVGTELDLNRIKQSRPEIATILNNHENE